LAPASSPVVEWPRSMVWFHRSTSCLSFAFRSSESIAEQAHALLSRYLVKQCCEMEEEREMPLPGIEGGLAACKSRVEGTSHRSGHVVIVFPLPEQHLFGDVCRPEAPRPGEEPGFPTRSSGT